MNVQYNLGSLYAQSKGVEQVFWEEAYWFHQAELGEDGAALEIRMSPRT